MSTFPIRKYPDQKNPKRFYVAKFEGNNNPKFKKAQMRRKRPRDRRTELKEIEEKTDWPNARAKDKAITMAKLHSRRQMDVFFEFDDVVHKKEYLGRPDDLPSQYEYVLLERQGSECFVYPVQMMKFQLRTMLEKGEDAMMAEARNKKRNEKISEQKQAKKRKLAEFVSDGLNGVEGGEDAGVGEMALSIAGKGAGEELHQTSKRHKKTRQRGQQEDLPDFNQEFSDDDEEVAALNDHDLVDNSEEDELDNGDDSEEDEAFQKLLQQVEDDPHGEKVKIVVKPKKGEEDSDDSEAFDWDRVGLSDEESNERSPRKSNSTTSKKPASKPASRPQKRPKPRPKPAPAKSKPKGLTKEYMISLLRSGGVNGISSKDIFIKVMQKVTMDTRELQGHLAQFLQKYGKLIDRGGGKKLWFLKDSVS